MIASVLLSLILAQARAAGQKPSEAYAAAVRYGQRVLAGDFSAPDRFAVSLDTAGCAIALYDPSQTFALDAKGRPAGEGLMCRVRFKKGGRTMSYVDLGCTGDERKALAEGGRTSSLTPAPGEFPEALSYCHEKALTGRLAEAWRKYCGKKDPSSRIALDSLGLSYRLAFGQDELARLAKTLASGEGDKRRTALEFFTRSAWWKRAGKDAR